MLNKNEVLVLLVVTLVLALSASITTNGLENLFGILLSVFIILILNTTAKKLSAFHFDSEIEVKLWEFKRYGLRPRDHFKNPIPIGIILPMLSKIILFAFRNFAWMASLIFDVKAKAYRAAKRHGIYSFSEMTEYHIGAIAATGIAVTLASAVIAYFLGFPLFSRLSIFYAFFNMIPLSTLDGNKIFFGSLILWSFLASITLIGMFFIIFPI